MDTPRPGRVVLLRESNMDDSWRGIQRVLEEHAIELNVEIRVENPHSDPRPVNTDEGFLYIYFWSAPEGYGLLRTSRIERAFDIELVGGQGDSFVPVSGLGNIMDSRGTVVAQFADSTLYVLFDLPHYRRNAQDLMRNIMEQFVLEARLTPEERIKRREEARLKEESRILNLKSVSKKEFPNVAKRALRTRMESFEGNRALLTDKVDVHRKQMEDAATSLEGLIKTSKLAKAVLKKKGTKWFDDLFDRLEKLSHDNNLWIEDDKLHIDMGQIDIPYKGKVYDIGVFELVVNIDPDNWSVKCINKTRKVGKVFHPHVASDGSCCFGNVKSTVHALIETLELEALVVFMKIYLQSVNESDWMNTIIDFPVKEKEKK